MLWCKTIKFPYSSVAQHEDSRLLMGGHEATWDILWQQRIILEIAGPFGTMRDIPNSVEQRGTICKVRSRKGSGDNVENLGKARGWGRRRKAGGGVRDSIDHRVTACVRAKSPQLERSQLAVTRKADPLRVSKMLFEGSSYLLVDVS